MATPDESRRASDDMDRLMHIEMMRAAQEKSGDEPLLGTAVSGSTCYLGRPADVIQRVETSSTGRIVLRIGYTLHTGASTQTAHVVLSHDEVTRLAPMLGLTRPDHLA